ncbi:MAG: response regulator transcription factor [Campylobacterota bacterium]|nr:response regulator transcription factor [Campylobacterota bacterium]
MRIFLVEDDIDLNYQITKILEGIGFHVASFTNGVDAISSISGRYDVYFIDLNLPDMHGLEVVQNIREAKIDAPVFIISGDNTINSIEKAYAIGCQDYIKKPFDVKELVIKINQIFNQNSHMVTVSKKCEYDLIKEILYFKNEMVHLTLKEKALFHVLAKNIGQTVSNEHIEAYVWGMNMENGYVRQLVNKLRKKVPCDIIKNHTANGYRLEKIKK